MTHPELTRDELLDMLSFMCGIWVEAERNRMKALNCGPKGRKCFDTLAIEWSTIQGIRNQMSIQDFVKSRPISSAQLRQLPAGCFELLRNECYVVKRP